MGQEITLPEHIKVIIWDGFWTRQDAIDNPDKLFLFGGNILQDCLLAHRPYVPSLTQAVIRGLPNACSIETKLTNGTMFNAYFTDEDVELFKYYLLKRTYSIGVWFGREEKFKVLVIPSRENGIGTGTAFLKQKAPKCWELLQEFLAPLYERAEGQKEVPTFYSYPYGRPDTPMDEYRDGKEFLNG